MVKKVVIAIVAFCLFIVGIFSIQKLVMPKYLYGSVPEGSLIEEYYSQSHDNQVIFVGDCECYENISPITMYNKYGITSTIRGSAQQLIWQSYYLMKETLKYETPRVFVFNVLAMQYGEPQKEEYNRLNLDGMKWSKDKWDSIQESMTEDESVVEYILPILRYHSRWSELKAEDFKYMFGGKPTISHRGFMMRVDVKKKAKIPEPTPLTDYRLPETCYTYLNKMVKLCDENHIDLMLIKAPSLYPAWHEEWDVQIQEFAEKNHLYYINLLSKYKKVGINWNKDTYDGGLHLNLSGAEKVATYLGKKIKKKYGLKSLKKNETVAASWAPVIEYYNQMKKDQEAELKEYGYLKSYGAKAPEPKTETKKTTTTKKKTTKTTKK
ncbi:MAG: SGNH/GDSL hydrolase family protein [Erysipelotrichaceae bacterium]|nr:SGNH/GDSL hydrolase family protein [Erysipelotrichaceae bacterium]